MEKVIGVVTARMSSKRLPGKVMKRIVEKSVFAHHVERMRNIKGLDGIFLATSKDPANRELIREAEQLGCGWYAGAEQDVVERHIELCQREAASAVVRVTCDSPLFDTESAATFVEEFRKQFWDYIYVSNVAKPPGIFKELVSHDALLKTHRHYKGPSVAGYIVENIDDFKTLGIEVDSELCRPEYRLSLDEAADLEVIQQIYKALYKGELLNLRDVYAWLDDNPQIAQINRHIEVSEVNKYFADLMHKPLYSIVASEGKYIVLDKQKQTIEPSEFIRKILDLFPELKEK